MPSWIRNDSDTEQRKLSLYFNTYVCPNIQTSCLPVLDCPHEMVVLPLDAVLFVAVDDSVEVGKVAVQVDVVGVGTAQKKVLGALKWNIRS
jgi:hypothetical protein